MMCIALALLGMTNSMAAAMLKANSLFSVFFIADNRPFRPFCKGRTAAGGAAVHKFNLPAVFLFQKRKPFGTEISERHNKTGKPTGFPIFAPTIIHSRSNYFAGQVFWLRL